MSAAGICTDPLEGEAVLVRDALQFMTKASKRQLNLAPTSVIESD